MEEQNYSKRELDHHFADIKDILKKQDSVLMEIKEQTTKTNGRVTANEKEISLLKFWKQAIVWGFGVLLTITLFVFDFIK